MRPFQDAAVGGTLAAPLRHSLAGEWFRLGMAWREARSDVLGNRQEGACQGLSRSNHGTPRSVAARSPLRGVPAPSRGAGGGATRRGAAPLHAVGCPPRGGIRLAETGLVSVRSLRDLAAGLSFARVSPAARRGVLAAALVAAGGLALPEPALGQAEVELLNTTLTPAVVPHSGYTVLGCGPTPRTPYYCGTIMTDDDFTEAGVTYSIRALRVRFRTDRTDLEISIGPKLSTRLKSMTLHADSASFAFGGTVSDDGPADGSLPVVAQPRPDLDRRHRRHDPADARQRRRPRRRTAKSSRPRTVPTRSRHRTSGSPTWTRSTGRVFRA